MLKIGVLVSGGGTNLQAIIDSIANGTIAGAEIVTVISSKQDAYALTRAKNHHIDAVYIGQCDFDSMDAYEQALVAHLKAHHVGLVVFAGYMTILSEKFINAFNGRIINVHPALIPAFSGKGFYGLKVHQAVLAQGVKTTGATVHFVTPEADAGPIILQKTVEVRDGDTPEILQKRVMREAEHIILPQAINMIADEESRRQKK